MKKVKKPKEVILSSKINNAQNHKTMEEIIHLVAMSEFEIAKNQIEFIIEEDEDPTLYNAVKARLAYEDKDFEVFEDYLDRLIYGGPEIKGLADFMVDLVNNENVVRLAQISNIARPMILASDPCSKGICLLCLLIWDFQTGSEMREIFLLKLFSITFDDPISLWVYYKSALELIEPYLEIDSLAEDLMNAIRRVQLINNN